MVFFASKILFTFRHLYLSFDDLILCLIKEKNVTVSYKFTNVPCH